MRTEKLKVFTFHYGPIQIELCGDTTPVVKKFTFHYGPIQMIHTKKYKRSH